MRVTNRCRTAAVLLLGTVALTCPRCKRSRGPMKKERIASKPLAALTPATFDGWTAGAPRELVGKGIFAALNGGAEIYLDFGFRRLLVREYEKSRRPRLQLHLFELRSAPDAFGIFTQEREGADAGVGEDSDYAGGLLRFWRGRYFVSVMVPRETPELKRAVLALGRSVAAKLPPSGGRPALLAWLPEAGRVAGSTRYLHTHAALMHHLRLGSQNLLGLHRRTAVVLASYGAGPQRLVGMAVRYGDAKRCQSAVAAANGWRAPRGTVPPGAAPRFTAVRCGRVLAGVWGPGPVAGRRALLGEITKRIPECRRDGQ